MVQVTLTLSREATEDLLDSMYGLYEAAEMQVQGTEQALAMVRTNIQSIAAALKDDARSREPQSVRIPSFTGDGSYVVSYDPTTDIYRCSCPSFAFERGLDSTGFCKHIRQALKEGLFHV